MGGEEFSHKYRDQLIKELEEAFTQFKVFDHRVLEDFSFGINKNHNQENQTRKFNFFLIK